MENESCFTAAELAEDDAINVELAITEYLAYMVP